MQQFFCRYANAVQFWFDRMDVNLLKLVLKRTTKNIQAEKFTVQGQAKTPLKAESCESV